MYALNQGVKVQRIAGDFAGITRQMCVRDRVAACVKEKAGVRLCARCIADELGLSGTLAVHEAVRHLTWAGRAAILGFASASGRCGPCGSTRQVIFAT